MKHKGTWFSALIVSLIYLAFGQAVIADVTELPNPSVTVVKRMTASSSEAMQETIPLAGAHYRLTRILPVEGKKIVAADPTTYTIASGEQGFTTELVTDENGQVVYDDAAKLIEGAYLLEELKGYGVDNPAAPIAFSLPFTDAEGKESDDFIYEPKSGLTGSSGTSATNPSGTGDSMNGQTGEDQKNQQNEQSQPVIMQTSGHVWMISQKALFSIVGLFLSMIIGGLVLLRRYVRGRKYE